MNALDLLKQDHDDVKDLLDEIEDCEDLSELEDLFLELKDMLKDHETIEEEIFYPELKRIREARALTLEAYQEHQILDYTLADMDDDDIGSEEWRAKLSVARELLEHHIQEEEEEMFPRAREAFEEGQLEDIGARLQERKQELDLSHM